MNLISSTKYLKANKIGITFQGNYPVGSTKLRFKLADESVNLYPYQRIIFELDSVTLIGNYNENYIGDKFIYLDTPTTVAIDNTTAAYFWWTSGQNADNELMLKADIIKNARGDNSLNYESQYTEFVSSNDIEYNTNFHTDGTPHFIDGTNQYKLNRLFTKVYRRKTIQETTFVSIGGVKIHQVDSVNHPNYNKAYFEFRISKANSFARFLVDFDIFNTIGNEKSHFLVTNLYQDIPNKIYLQFNYVRSENSTGEEIKYIDVKLRGQNLGEVDIEFSVFDKLDMYIPAGFASKEILDINFIGKNEIEFFEGILGYNTKHRFNLVLPGDTYVLPKQISAGTNLNDIKTSGYYYCWSNNDVSTIINYPTGDNRKIFNLIVGKDSIGVYQELTVLNQTNLNSWRRYLIDGTTWSEWYTFAKQKHTHKAADDIIEDTNHRFVTDAQIQSWNKAVEDIGSSSWLQPIAGMTGASAVKGNVFYNLNDNHIYRYNGSAWTVIDIQILGIDGNINTKLNNSYNNGFLVSQEILGKIALGSLSKGYKNDLNETAYIHAENNVLNYNIAGQSIDLVKRTENYIIEEKSVFLGQNITNTNKGFNSHTIIIGSDIVSNKGTIFGTGIINTNTESIFGNYNLDIPNTKFVLGTGFSDINRDTALFVDDNGFLNVKNGLKSYIINPDNTVTVSNEKNIFLTDGTNFPLLELATKWELNELDKRKVEKGGEFTFKLVAEDNSEKLMNLIFDVDSTVIETPIGLIIVDSYGNTTFYNGNIALDGDNNEVTVSAEFSVNGSITLIEAFINDDDIAEPLDISGYYNHPGGVYLTIVDFGNGTVTFSNGQVVKYYDTEY